MESYKFSVPIRINHIADESTISIENIHDLKDIEERYDIDLEFIIEEFEYKVEAEREASDNEDEEYFGISDDDIFNDVITDNWDEIVRRLHKEQRLNDFEDNDKQILFDIVKEKFGKYALERECVGTSIEGNFKVLSIGFTDYCKTKSEMYLTVETDQKLKKDEIELLRSWVEFLTAEEWGEKFSKIDLSDKLNTEDVYVYLIPWSLNKDVKYIK